jgi:2-polyprenyl-6-methoxyphenol hydroxylase-like FAD-dependent oxidoreductase
MARYDVVVCGAGAGGLTLAAALGRAGRSVLLLDKARGTAETFKGEVLQPRSLGIFAQLGVLDRLYAAGTARVDQLVCADPTGRRICAMDYRALPPPHNFCLTQTYKGLVDALGSSLPPEVEFRRGVRALDLVRDDDGRITGLRLAEGKSEQTVRAPLVAACDGASSRLRTAAGITVDSEPYPHQVVAFDLVGVDHLPPQAVTLVTPVGIRLVYPMPDGRGRLYAQIPRGTTNRMGKQGLGSWVNDMLRATPAFAHVADAVRTGLSESRVLSARRFVADTWQLPGLVLVGDAAHAVHPMAGQGMNAAIADAAWLAEELHGVDLADPAALDRATANYQRSSAGRMEFVSRFSHNFATLFTGTSTREWLTARYILRRHGHNPRLSFKVMYNLSGLGVMRFTFVDRLQQLGLPDPRANDLPRVA